MKREGGGCREDQDHPGGTRRNVCGMQTPSLGMG